LPPSELPGMTPNELPVVEPGPESNAPPPRAVS
jgi:hypothetical protein